MFIIFQIQLFVLISVLSSRHGVNASKLKICADSPAEEFLNVARLEQECPLYSWPNILGGWIQFLDLINIPLRLPSSLVGQFGYDLMLVHLSLPKNDFLCQKKCYQYLINVKTQIDDVYGNNADWAFICGDIAVKGNGYSAR